MPGQDETGGRGLLLVEALARGWGVQPNQADARKTHLTSVRDSKRPTGPVLRFTHDSWRSFVGHID